MLEISDAIGRTADSVVYKVANLRFLDSGGTKGLSHVGRTDRLVWEEFEGKEEFLEREARRILRNTSAEPDADAQDAEVSHGQGFLASPQERRRVEEIAMSRARLRFASEGYEVEDVHSRMPCDLKCTKGKEELFVEVKGTTGDGKRILLTGGEVSFAKRHLSMMALFIIHSIKLGHQEDSNSGTEVVLRPWRIENSRLIPSNFVYEL